MIGASVTLTVISFITLSTSRIDLIIPDSSNSSSSILFSIFFNLGLSFALVFFNSIFVFNSSILFVLVLIVDSSFLTNSKTPLSSKALYNLSLTGRRWSNSCLFIVVLSDAKVSISLRKSSSAFFTFILCAGVTAIKDKPAPRTPPVAIPSPIFIKGSNAPWFVGSKGTRAASCTAVIAPTPKPTLAADLTKPIVGPPKGKVTILIGSINPAPICFKNEALDNVSLALLDLSICVIRWAIWFLLAEFSIKNCSWPSYPVKSVSKGL